MVIGGRKQNVEQRFWRLGRDLGDGIFARTECGAFGVESVECLEDCFESAFAAGLLSAQEAALILFAEIGLDGFVVTIGDADELRGKAVTKDFEFVQLGFEGLSLARTVPFANDGLERDIGPQRQVISAGADLHGRPEGVFKFLPTFVCGPVLGDFALGKVDEVKRPPFFDFERALEGERIEKGELPIVVLRQSFEHGAHGILAAVESEKFSDKELRAAAIDVEGFSLEESVGGPAQVFESEHGMRAQKFAGRLERILHHAVGPGEEDPDSVVAFARRRHDDFHFAGGQKLFGEAFDEPGRKVGGTSAGVAIGEFEQESLSHGPNVLAATHDVGKLNKIFPAIAEAFAVDRDRAIRPRREKKRQMNAAAPGSGVGEVAIEELFDALGGDGEQCWVEDNEGRVCAEVICSFGWTSAAGVMNQELAADAASQSGVLGVGKKGNEQEGTEGTEQTKRPQLKRTSASRLLCLGSLCYLLFN